MPLLYSPYPIFLLLLLLAPSAFILGSPPFDKGTGPIVADDQCPEKPMDVEKHQTGEVCYRGAEGEGMPKMYSFYGEKIAGEPDSKIYKVPIFHNPSYQQHVEEDKIFAVKVVSTGHLARSLHLAKPVVMIRHELDMLKAFNEAEQKHGHQQSVVKLLGGGEVMDNGFMDNPLNVDVLPREFSMIYVMEFGEQTLDRYLKKLGQKWSEDEEKYTDKVVEEEMEQLLGKLFQTVANFHKYALHLHLKPGNWILVEGKWKLIDLQSAIPRTDLLLQQDNHHHHHNGDHLFLFKGEKSPEDIVEFACNSLGNEVMLLTKLLSKLNERPTTYASPEHAHACSLAHPLLKEHFYSNWFSSDKEKRKTMKEQLATITPKSDVWSLGILILELLAHTPQMNPKLKHRDPIELFGEMRSEWVGELLTEGVPFALKFKEFFHFLGHRDKVKVEDRDIKMGMHMKELKQHFPRIFAILTKIFVAKPSKRADLAQLLEIVHRQT